MWRTAGDCHVSSCTTSFSNFLKLRFHPQKYTKCVEQIHQGNKTEQPDDAVLVMSQEDDPSEQTRLIESDSSGSSLHFTALNSCNCCSLLFLVRSRSFLGM